MGRDARRLEMHAGALRKRTLEPGLQGAPQPLSRHLHASQPLCDFRDGLPLLVALLDKSIEQARTGSVVCINLLTAPRSVTPVRDEWHERCS